MPSSRRVRPATSGDGGDAQPGVLVGPRHRLLDQPRHHPRRGEADGVGAVPGRRQVDHAELLTGHRVVDRRGPADPVVHDRGVVLGREHHGRPAQPVGQVEGVGADALVVPPRARHEVHRLRLAAHDPTAVGPQHPGVAVRDRQHEVAVLGRAPEVVLDPGDRDLQRRPLPVGAGLLLVGQRRVGDVGGDGRAGPGPAAVDLGAHQALGPVAVLDERRPRVHGGLTTPEQVGVVLDHPVTLTGSFLNAPRPPR